RALDGKITRSLAAARRGRERLPGSLGDDLHLDPGLLGEQRQNFREQTRVFDRCRRGEHDALVRRWCGSGAIAPNHPAEQEQNHKSDRSHRPPFSPSTKPVALTAMLRPISTSPGPTATGNSPLLVSSTMVVVIVRV